MPSRLPVMVICVTILIDAIGIGLILPVTPALLREVTHEGLANAAIWGGVLAALFAVMQFLFGPVLGSLSDRYGRRPVLLVSLLVVALDYMLMALAHTLTLLIIGRAIGGLASATHATAAAYMADVSAPENKARNFGLINAAFGLGFVLGPLAGAGLAEFGTRAPFWAAAALAALNAVIGYFVLPETVTDRIRRPFDIRRANPFGAFRAIGRLPGLPRFLIVYLLYCIALFSYPAVWPFFGEAQFGWNSRMVGISLAVFGVGMAVVQGFLIAPMIRRFGDGRTVVIGMCIDVASFVALGFITSGTLALALTPLTALGGVVGPALTAVMSRRARDDQQGELQGVLASLNALNMVISPLVMTQVFAHFTSGRTSVHLPGAPFLLAAALMVVCVLLFTTRTRLLPSGDRARHGGRES
ncbi:MFS transporter [Haematobacter missouriensis]|uniref:MFS transporter n=1 Tax=Haematobacter missouriensis TaxID=366616 RepID=A0A212AYD2_9RHOB|nr:TCR/Tet family MFS transporter [Haematobacter missouriensis]KFI33159.1 MFS transporter [Haematobacter missouriensis]OWJ78631.1 MFS transporter [Haematobacter missouriensis]OWJ86489.1 MFS transporter [Haematobacter missouriensis]